MLVGRREQELVPLALQKVVAGVLSQVKYIFQSRSSPQEAAVVMCCFQLDL